MKAAASSWVFWWGIVLGCAGFRFSGGAAEVGTLELAGRWRFALDRNDEGVTERWFDRSLGETVRLPGSLPQQGIGDPVSTNTPWMGEIVDRGWFTDPEYEAYRQAGNVKVPFWLQPETYYAGPAWYQREVSIPRRWGGQRVVLHLERPHGETRVWLDDRLVGSSNALGTPHEHVLGMVAPGRHRLTVRVDNRLGIDVGVNSHSVSDHTQGNWNGIVGRIELRSTPALWIEDIQFYPEAKARSVRVEGRIGNGTGRNGVSRVTMRFQAMLPGARGPEATGGPIETEMEANWDANGGSFRGVVSLGEEAPLWDEFQRALFEATATLGASGHRVTGRFGLRDFAATGSRFTINGRPVFLRGTLECSIFPRTGHPPVDVESWRGVMGVLKAHGLNHLRFHSHCPPEAAFVAADEMGVYLHVEASSWANQSTTLGDGKPVDTWIYEETERILRQYGNHPSFVLMAYGNEPGGPRHTQFLAKWLTYFKGRDGRRLWTAAAGWPQLLENQWHCTPDPRIQRWGQGLRSRINADPPETVTDYREYVAAREVPVVSHEIGQWCVYPNFDELRKYTGYLKPRNFEIFRDRLAAAGMLGMARAFLEASGKLQTLCYKEEIESALRSPGMAGFQLLGLHDFPGQGTALVGVLDPFWEEKGYVTAGEFRRFAGPTVPLVRLAKRVFTRDEFLVAPVEVAHFGSDTLRGQRTTWRLADDRGREVASGEFSARDVPVDNGVVLGTVRINLAGAPVPARYRLGVEMPEVGAANDWDVWVYPEEGAVTVPQGVTECHEFDAAMARLRSGGRVIWYLGSDMVAPDRKRGSVDLGFSSIFWNTAWTGRQAPHTLGILCDPKHPLFAAFPTDRHTNWQWWYLVTRAGAMILDGLPRDLRPTVQVIDDWVTARKLGLVFEARVGAGRLLVCSIDLDDERESDPVSRQFRRSLLGYVASDLFRPRVDVTIEQLRGLGTD